MLESFGSCAVALLYLAISLAIGGALGKHFKGDQKNGTLLGLLGPLGWACVILLRDKRALCPACRSALNPGAVKCARCGADVPRVPMPNAAAVSRATWKSFALIVAIVAVALVAMVFLAVKFG